MQIFLTILWSFFSCPVYEWRISFSEHCHTVEKRYPGELLFHIPSSYFWQQKYPKLPRVNKLALPCSNLFSFFMTLRQYLLSDSQFCSFFFALWRMNEYCLCTDIKIRTFLETLFWHTKNSSHLIFCLPYHIFFFFHYFYFIFL